MVSGRAPFMALVIIWLKLPKVWRAFAYVSVASGLIKLRVSEQAEPGGL